MEIIEQNKQNHLKNLRLSIYTCEIKIIDFIKDIMELKKEIDDIASNESFSIREALDVFEKSLYSNQEKRDRELKIRLEKNQVYQEKLTVFNNSQYTLDVLKVELQDKKLMFKEIEIMSRIGE